MLCGKNNAELAYYKHNVRDASESILI